jgi:hypothetical protein
VFRTLQLCLAAHMYPLAVWSHTLRVLDCTHVPSVNACCAVACCVVLQAERWGSELYTEDVDSIDLSARPFTITSSERTIKAHSVIIATGATARRLSIPSEEKVRCSGAAGGPGQQCCGGGGGWRNSSTCLQQHGMAPHHAGWTPKCTSKQKV